jgi:DHA2 family multidrug resistance protein
MTERNNPAYAKSRRLPENSPRDRLQHMTDFLMSRGADAVSAHAAAIESLGFSVRQQSFFMAYNDCFVALAFVLLASIPVLFFMSKQKTTGGGGAH